MNIIGITSHIGNNHDSSAALLVDGKVVFAEAEERVSRKKHDKSFPEGVIKEMLNKNKLKRKDIDFFASAAPPAGLLIKLKSYLNGFRYVGVMKIIEWILLNALLLLRRPYALSTNQFTSYEKEGYSKKKLLFIPHHLAHAESTYNFSGMDKCLVVAWDGYGPDERGYPWCGAIYKAENGNLSLLERIPVWSSIGLYYGAVTIALGFKLNDGEGKTMGLAAYGKKSGAVSLMRKFFPHFTNNHWKPNGSWIEVIGVSRNDYYKHTTTYKKLKQMIENYGEKDTAYAAQLVFEEECEKYFRYLGSKYGMKDFAVAGGLFLNVKFNMRILQNKVARTLFVYPNPGDGGVAIGAAIAAQKMQGYKIKRFKLDSASLGCSYNAQDIEKAVMKYKNQIRVQKYSGNALYEIAAQKISEGKVLGWFHGRSEWGPRALGNRSVIADPRNPKTKDHINANLKKRDWFMPFAPSITEENVNIYTVDGFATPFMTLADKVKKDVAKNIGAATHVDGTARFQTVSRSNNLPYWTLINEFEKITGVPVILNTSFNMHGLPIVHTPENALDHLIWGCIDELVIGNYVIVRAN